MRKLCFIITIIVTIISCQEQKEKTIMPVETNDGIGDGAPSLDSLLKQQKDTLQIKPLKDTL